MGQKIKCLKCNDIIESKSIHDFVWCKCGAIFIDGGDDYTRCGGEIENIEFIKDCKTTRPHGGKEETDGEA